MRYLVILLMTLTMFSCNELKINGIETRTHITDDINSLEPYYSTIEGIDVKTTPIFKYGSSYVIGFEFIVEVKSFQESIIIHDSLKNIISNYNSYYYITEKYIIDWDNKILIAKFRVIHNNY